MLSLLPCGVRDKGKERRAPTMTSVKWKGES